MSNTVQTRIVYAEDLKKENHYHGNDNHTIMDVGETRYRIVFTKFPELVLYYYAPSPLFRRDGDIRKDLPSYISFIR